jgi:hypothetical protein
MIIAGNKAESPYDMPWKQRGRRIERRRRQAGVWLIRLWDMGTAPGSDGVAVTWDCPLSTWAPVGLVILSPFFLLTFLLRSISPSFCPWPALVSPILSPICIRWFWSDFITCISGQGKERSHLSNFRLTDRGTSMICQADSRKKFIMLVIVIVRCWSRQSW